MHTNAVARSASLCSQYRLTALTSSIYRTRIAMTKRRNQKYVDREVQSSLLRRMTFHWFLFLVANGIGMLLWTRLVESSTETWNETLIAAGQRLVPFAIISLAIIPVFILDAMKLSNRFAGPIVRVRRSLAQIANGEIPKPIEFRTGDFWKSLAHDMNRAFAFRSSPASSSSEATN
jgi:hypothetical protein